MLLNTARIIGLATIAVVGAIGTLVVAQQEKGNRAGPPGNARINERPGPTTTNAPEPPARIPARDVLDAKREQVERMLDESIKLDLPESMTLGDFVEALKKATAGAHFTGLPIALDPIGLHEARVSSATRVFPYPVKGAKLRDVLRWTLYDTRLSFAVVRGGAVLVSSRGSVTDRRLEDLQEQINDLAQAIRRIEGAPRGPTHRSPGS